MKAKKILKSTLCSDVTERHSFTHIGHVPVHWLLSMIWKNRRAKRWLVPWWSSCPLCVSFLFSRPLLMMMRQMVKTAVRYAWVFYLFFCPLRGNNIFFSPRICFPLNTAPQLASLPVSLCPQNIYLKKWSKKKKQNKTQMKQMIRKNPRAKR